MNFFKKNWALLLLFIALALITGVSYYYYKTFDKCELHYVPDSSDIEFRTFDKERDTKFILDAFNPIDYYWLVENPTFSPKFMLEHISPNRDTKYFGKLNIKIGFKNNEPIGFTTYFMENYYKGKIQFVYITPKFRGKGYSHVITKHAIDDLFNKGAKLVWLQTRGTDIPARKAYTRLGFKQTEDDGKFVTFEMKKS